jgi:hypothetical protein
MLDAGPDIEHPEVHQMDLMRKARRTRNMRNEAKHAKAPAKDFACFASFRVFRVLFLSSSFIKLRENLWQAEPEPF